MQTQNNSTKEWAEQTETATRVRQPEDVKEAKRVFQHELSLQEQLTLSEEIVTTRSAELCRAYHNIVDLYFGFRRKKNARTKREQVVREACITFVVKMKWADSEEEDPDERLPDYLFAYWVVGGRRKLVAVPTDVEDAKSYAEVKLDSDPSKIHVVVPEDIELPADVSNRLKTEGEIGAVTCALERSGFPDKTYLMSCRHVFSASASIHPKEIWGSSVRLQDGSIIGITRPVAGRLGNEGKNMDAQLAEMTSPDALHQALNGIRLTGFISRTDGFPKTTECLIATPVGPKKAQFSNSLPNLNISYHGTAVQHSELVELELLDKPTVGGDSGSPVVTRLNEGILLGMHIGTRSRIEDNKVKSYALMIPAWNLFSPAFYERTSSNENWQLVQPEALEPHVAATDAERPAVVSDDVTLLTGLLENHRHNGSVAWRLDKDGIRIEDVPPEVTVGPPTTAGKVWQAFGGSIEAWASHYQVPVELIIATICTESTGDPKVIRREPGFQSDEATPGRISVGLMQTLIATARDTLRKSKLDRNLDKRMINREWLFEPHNSIHAGACYIHEQFRFTRYDPPKVACAYNAGQIRTNDSPQNRWKMRQFPIGTSQHADRFIKWFNDSFRFFKDEGLNPRSSFFAMLNQR